MLELQLRTNKAVIARERGSVYCEISLLPGPGEVSRRRSPVAIVLCLDRSGSMAGAAGGRHEIGNGRQVKIIHARHAAEQAVDQLMDGDWIGLVTFSTEVRVDMPLTAVTPGSRERIVECIRAIEPEASTNLAGGLGTAAELFGPAHRHEFPCKVIAISDGLANVGVSDPQGLARLARGFRDAGVTISTIGVGDDYSAATMSAMAQAGGGEFYHVSDAAEIEAALAAEVSDIKSVAARQARILLMVPRLVAVGTNLNFLPQRDVQGGVAIEVGDVVRERRIYVELATPVGIDGSELALSVECQYIDPATSGQVTIRTAMPLGLVSEAVFAAAPFDEAVTGILQEMIRAAAVREASSAYERGDLKLASTAIRNHMSFMQASDLGFSDVDADVKAFAILEDRMLKHQVGQDEAKTLLSRAYATHTSRRPRGKADRKEG